MRRVLTSALCLCCATPPAPRPPPPTTIGILVTRLRLGPIAFNAPSEDWQAEGPEPATLEAGLVDSLVGKGVADPKGYPGQSLFLRRIGVEGGGIVIKVFVVDPKLPSLYDAAGCAWHPDTPRDPNCRFTTSSEYLYWQDVNDIEGWKEVQVELTPHRGKDVWVLIKAGWPLADDQVMQEALDIILSDLSLFTDL